jgi:hypothetical protein
VAAVAVLTVTGGVDRIAAGGDTAHLAIAPAPLGPHPVPPLYPLLYSWTATGAEIAAVQQRLVAACMTHHGFHYQAPPLAGPDTVAAEVPTPFGLESPDPPRAATPVAAATAPTDPRYAAALLGDPDRRVVVRAAGITVTAPATGCIAEAETRLLGADRGRWMQLRILLFAAEHAALRALDADRSYRQLTAAWSRCVAARTGYHAPDPFQLQRAVLADHALYTGPVPRADLWCKAETHYLPLAYGRLAALQRHELDADPSVLRDWRRIRASQALIARSLARKPWSGGPHR